MHEYLMGFFLSGIILIQLYHVYKKGYNSKSYNVKQNVISSTQLNQKNLDNVWYILLQSNGDIYSF